MLEFRLLRYPVDGAISLRKPSHLVAESPRDSVGRRGLVRLWEKALDQTQDTALDQAQDTASSLHH